MPRDKLSPIERAAEKERKENLRNIMKGLDVKNFDDLKDVFKMMVGEMLENGLDGELDDELGYTKYDYRNKEGENSRNGYSKKTLKASFGETEIKVPRDRDGEFEPQLVKKNQTTLTVPSQQKWTQKSFKKRNESQYFVNLLKPTAFIPRFACGRPLPA